MFRSSKTSLSPLFPSPVVFLLWQSATVLLCASVIMSVIATGPLCLVVVCSSPRFYSVPREGYMLRDLCLAFVTSLIYYQCK